MTHKHTPAPWLICDDGNEDRSRDIIFANVDGESVDIALLCTELPIAIRKANTRLIRQSPALLEELQELIALLPDAGIYYESPADHRRLEDRIKSAQAVIAAALGEVPPSIEKGSPGYFHVAARAFAEELEIPQEVAVSRLSNLQILFIDKSRSQLEALLQEKETVFNRTGGRGVELADEIDDLRGYLASITAVEGVV